MSWYSRRTFLTVAFFIANKSLDQFDFKFRIHLFKSLAIVMGVGQIRKEYAPVLIPTRIPALDRRESLTRTEFRNAVYFRSFLAFGDPLSREKRSKDFLLLVTVGCRFCNSQRTRPQKTKEAVRWEGLVSLRKSRRCPELRNVVFHFALSW